MFVTLFNKLSTFMNRQPIQRYVNKSIQLINFNCPPYTTLIHFTAVAPLSGHFKITGLRLIICPNVQINSF